MRTSIYILLLLHISVSSTVSAQLIQYNTYSDSNGDCTTLESNDNAISGACVRSASGSGSFMVKNLHSLASCIIVLSRSSLWTTTKSASLWPRILLVLLSLQPLSSQRFGVFFGRHDNISTPFRRVYAVSVMALFTREPSQQVIIWQPRTATAPAKPSQVVLTLL